MARRDPFLVRKKYKKGMLEMMTSSERIKAVLNFQDPDRLPVMEWAVWWDLTIERWQREGGFPAGCNDRYEITRQLGLDMHYQGYVLPFNGEKMDAVFKGKNCGHGDGPVATDADYEALLPACYDLKSVEQSLPQWQRWAEERHVEGSAVWLTFWGFFGWPRYLFGIEPHMLAFYDHPELMHRMNRELLDHYRQCLDLICTVCVPDFIALGEDMSYNNGPMLSKACFDEFLKPYYLELTARAKAHGIPVLVDSDGDVTALCGWVREGGCNGIFPLERQAGTDVAKLRRLYPDMAFMGAFDKMTMDKGEAAMRAEFERLLPVARQGGLIIGCDHQTPPAVSFQDYQLYLRLFREYAEEACR